MLQDIAVAYTTYLLGTLSPGPANLAIMQTSLEHGRKAGLSLSLGILTVSIFWGCLAAFGLERLLAEFPTLIKILSIAGGIYIWWLGFKNLAGLKKEYRPGHKNPEKGHIGKIRRYFFAGMAIHLTNPKSVLVWSAVILLGTSHDMPDSYTPYVIVSGCAILGVFVFCGYAVLFSGRKMVELYIKMRTLIVMVVSVFFFFAGFSLLYDSFMP